MQVEIVQPLWESVLAGGASLAAMVVAYFAYLQIERERLRDARDECRGHERRRAADARVSALAFMLRRQLRSWVGIEPERQKGLEEWQREARSGDSFALELDRAETRVMEILAVADEASEYVAGSVREAAIYFLAGTNRLNQFVGTPQPTSRKIPDWLQLCKDAERELHQAIHILQAKVIQPDILKVEKSIQSTRMTDPLEKHRAAVERYYAKSEDIETSTSDHEKPS